MHQKNVYSFRTVLCIFCETQILILSNTSSFEYDRENKISDLKQNHLTIGENNFRKKKTNKTRYPGAEKGNPLT